MQGKKLIQKRFEILLNNQALGTNLQHAIQSVRVEDELNMPTMFSFVLPIFVPGLGGAKGLQKIDKKFFDTFAPGIPVEIKMSNTSAPKKLMKGEIAALEPEFNEDSTLEVRGYDKMFHLRFGTKQRAFKDVKDSGLAKKLAQEVGLQLKGDKTTTTYPYLFQNNQSNYDFLLDRANRINFELAVEDSDLYFRKSGDGKTASVELTFEEDLIRFSPRLKVLTENSSVEVRGYDLKKKDAISSKAKKGDELVKAKGKEKSGYEFGRSKFKEATALAQTEPVVDATEAQALAKARYQKTLSEFITGEGEALGNPDIRAGNTIKLKNLGEKFSGTYYVISSVHTWDLEGYNTTFKVRRSLI